MLRSFPAAQASFHGARHDLFQRWIGDEKCCDDAGMRRIGAAQLQRGWRAVSFRIARIGRQFGNDFIGTANDWIETVKRLIAVEGAADLILERDTSGVKTGRRR